MSERIGAQGFVPVRLDRLIEESVDQALKADPESGKQEIDKLRRFIFQAIRGPWQGRRDSVG
jgi:hypothetical protein